MPLLSFSTAKKKVLELRWRQISKRTCTWVTYICRRTDAHACKPTRKYGHTYLPASLPRCLPTCLYLPSCCSYLATCSLLPAPSSLPTYLPTSLPAYIPRTRSRKCLAARRWGSLLRRTALTFSLLLLVEPRRSALPFGPLPPVAGALFWCLPPLY